MSKPTYGEVRRYSSSTYVLDLPAMVRQFLKKVNPQSSKVGEREVWARYGRSNSRSGPQVVKVGPTEESVR